MPKFEQQPDIPVESEEKQEESPESESEKGQEQEPTLREVGRERIERIGSFFSRMKEGFKDRVRRTGEAISSAAGKAKEIGVAGLETVMAAPEAIQRGVEFTVGAGVMAYEKGKKTVIAAKDKVIEAKDAVVQKGKDAVEWGIQTCVDAKDATIEFGNRALYHAAERISRPFLKFQSRRLSHSLRYMAERVERGKVNMEDYDEVRRLLNHLEGLGAI